MVQQVRINDGTNTILQFPDGMSKQEMQDAIEKYYLPSRQNSSKNTIKNTTISSHKPTLYQKYLEPSVDATKEGLERSGAGIGQLVYPLVDKALGTNLTNTMQKSRDASAKAFNEKYKNDIYTRGMADFMQAVPYLGVPELSAETLAGKATGSALTNAAIGGAQEAPDTKTRLKNMGLSSIVGGLSPFPVTAVKKLYNASPTSKQLAKSLTTAGIGAFLGHHLAGDVGGLTGALISTPIGSVLGGKGQITDAVFAGVNPKKAIPKLEAGKRIGIHLTPAEAGNSSLAAAVQGKAGIEGKNAELLQNKAQERQLSEGKQIKDFLNEIDPSEENANSAIRLSAQNIIKNHEDNLKNLVQPWYEKSYKEAIPINKLKALTDSNGTIEDAVNSVLKDKDYKEELTGYAPNSIKVLDLAKRHIDSRIEQEKNFGNNDKVRVLTSAKNKLITATDSFSKNYSKARQLFSQGSEPIEKIKESSIGKLANLNDNQLKNVSKIIFDPQETDLKTFRFIKNNLQKQDPEAWSKIVRNDMENKIDKVDNTPGSGFYQKVLRGNRGFQRYMEALSHDPKLQQKLVDMRDVYSTLLNPKNAKTGYGHSLSNVDLQRNDLDAFKKLAAKIAGKKNDRAAIELMYNPKWDKELKNIKGIKSIPRKNNELLNTLNIINKYINNKIPKIISSNINNIRI